jgi:hypothetical protein
MILMRGLVLFFLSLSLASGMPKRYAPGQNCKPSLWERFHLSHHHDINSGRIAFSSLILYSPIALLGQGCKPLWAGGSYDDSTFFHGKIYPNWLVDRIRSGKIKPTGTISAKLLKQIMSGKKFEDEKAQQAALQFEPQSAGVAEAQSPASFAAPPPPISPPSPATFQQNGQTYPVISYPSQSDTSLQSVDQAYQQFQQQQGFSQEQSQSQFPGSSAVQESIPQAPVQLSPDQAYSNPYPEPQPITAEPQTIQPLAPPRSQAVAASAGTVSKNNDNAGQWWNAYKSPSKASQPKPVSQQSAQSGNTMSQALTPEYVQQIQANQQQQQQQWA